MNEQQSTLTTDPNDPANWDCCDEHETAFPRGEACPGCVGDMDIEPPEPDGECYRGGEAAGALAEEQARIQRELK